MLPPNEMKQTVASQMSIQNQEIFRWIYRHRGVMRELNEVQWHAYDIHVRFQLALHLKLKREKNH